ncbi:glycosyltransferase [Mariniflexile gromovii]|uniref:Glycosyltransferase n=2 Tax=Mariniflexile gromovii TaxID=362523 RepID=A0ABS4BQJ5_9FLAO|nr:glycosyltransferase [Mariniflexile gromovii]
MESNIINNIIIHGKQEKGIEYLDSSGKATKQFYIPIQREINIFKDLKCIYQTIKILKKEKPDLIHAHSAKGGVISRIASLFYSINVLHTPHAFSYLSAHSPVKRYLFLSIERVLKNFNSILLATSESELKRGIDEVGYQPHKAFLFNNSITELAVVDNNSTVSSLAYNFSKDYICTVGRPSYQKNIEMMVEIIKNVKDHIPNIHLVVMGLGVVSPNSENVKMLISKHNLEKNFTLIDWIEREKIFEIVSKSKFYLSTSRYEGLPYSIIESLSLRKAIIATDCDGNRDLVINDFNGYLLKENQLDQFKEKIIELYYNNETREKFEKNSFLLFKEKFDISINIRKLEKIYLKHAKYT